jgi:acetyl-CoA acyltransferase 1
MIYVLVGLVLHSCILFNEPFHSGTCHPPSPLYISRAAAIAAGIPYDVPISVVNRLCSSGLMAIRNIAHAIQAGEISIGLAVGMESMSLK